MRPPQSALLKSIHAQALWAVCSGFAVALVFGMTACGGNSPKGNTAAQADAKQRAATSTLADYGCQGLVDCEKSCNGGDTASCEWLGNMYETGEGAPQDYQRAAQLYDIACAGGQDEACAHLAMMYDIGLAVEEDTNRASELYKKACKSGNRWACKRGQQLN